MRRKVMILLTASVLTALGLFAMAGARPRYDFLNKFEVLEATVDRASVTYILDADGWKVMQEAEKHLPAGKVRYVRQDGSTSGRNDSPALLIFDNLTYYDMGSTFPTFDAGRCMVRYYLEPTSWDRARRWFHNLLDRNQGC